MSVSIDIILDELMSHYDVFRISDLADKMGVSQQTVSAWKSRNSINAIKKKCRELGIFNEIFHNFNIQSIQSIRASQVAQNVQGSQNSTNEDVCKDIDIATQELIKEAYKKAKQENTLKEFRIHIMSF